MQIFMKYQCKSCGMIFYKHSTKLLKREEKSLTCPYCESELWIPIINNR